MSTLPASAARAMDCQGFECPYLSARSANDSAILTDSSAVAASRDFACQRAALQELENETRGTVAADPEIDHVHDVRMSEASDGLCLHSHAVREVGAPRVERVQDFEREPLL